MAALCVGVHICHGTGMTAGTGETGLGGRMGRITYCRKAGAARNLLGT